MNETATASTTTSESVKFVWRRLTEPLQIGGWDFSWWWTTQSHTYNVTWLLILGAVLALALFYVVWMYIKDSQGIGALWGILLGFLRLCAYAVLALVFLLPARQTDIQTTSQGKVLVVFDVSDSQHISDQLPTGRSDEKLSTRMDDVLAFLADKKVAFFPRLEEKNPLTASRFGSQLDNEYLHFAGGKVWTREEREKPEKIDDKIVEPEPGPLPAQHWRAWLTPRAPFNPGTGLSDRDGKRLEKLDNANKKAVKEGLTRATNLYEPLLNLIAREHSSRIQGIVVFTDGRSNEGSAGSFRELERKARENRIPIFVVAVGEDRQKVKININEVRLPSSIQPDDKFRAVADITGEGLSGQKLDVTLEVVHVQTSQKKTKDKDGKVITEEKEEFLPIELIEAENPNDPKATRQKISLGTKLQLKPPTEPVLGKDNPPRVEVEWQLDAAALAAAAKIDLSAGDYKGKKWEIAECKEDSELKFTVRVPVDPREGVLKDKKKDPKTGKMIEVVRKVHESDRSPLKVIKKPIRVLLVTAAANRDYQFVRTLLVREVEKKRIELAIYFQRVPGYNPAAAARTGVVQDVRPERLLRTPPDTYGVKKDLYDLSSYDVIVAFDPDWRQFTKPQIDNIKRWAEKGGGLVLIGGYINTVELIRPHEGSEADRYQPILDMLPVLLDDRRDYIERKTDDPWALEFDQATPEMEFLKLDEDLDESKFKDDWKAFFYGKGSPAAGRPERGFFNFYPVLKAKTGSIVVARFTDPAAKLKDNTLHPYIVMNPDTLARVMWIGSAETWRLREYREEFHERFWTKLVRYAAAKSKGGAVQAIRPEIPSTIPANRYMQVDARIDGPDGNPLNRNIKPEITLKMPPGVSEKEIRQPIFMSPRPGGKDGWFSARFQVRSPGEYELTIKVPRHAGQDTDLVQTGKFIVTESNPELDNTRPDFDRMYRLASEADDVLLRMAEADRNELKRKLQRPKIETSPDAAGDKLDIREDKLRLYFDLKNAHLIPTCMIQDIQTQTSVGRINDLWDEDFVDLGRRLAGQDPQAKEYQRPDESKKVGVVLILVVVLFSAEWLIRKLLRLA
jgi:hypothetical protein